MKRTILLTSFVLGACALVPAQITSVITKSGEKPTIAVPDFRGAGGAEPFMAVFNTTLFNDLQSSGQLKMITKTLYPTQVPQQPSDFRPPANGQSQGPWLTDW